eukprot:349945-Chlamydomonas_euryale.AAC.2
MYSATMSAMMPNASPAAAMARSPSTWSCRLAIDSFIASMPASESRFSELRSTLPVPFATVVAATPPALCDAM